MEIKKQKETEAMSDTTKKNAQAGTNAAAKQTPMKDDADMPIEEYQRRLAEAEQKLRVAESDLAILRECIVRMSLERCGVLR